jgi:hypothetical protein
MSSWLPTKDADLLSFVTAMSAKITAAPTTYGLVAADATILSGLLTTYASALATANNPSTRTKTAVINKNVAKAQLVADVRSVAKRVQANPAVTAGQKTDLGLPVHSNTPTPVPPPSSVPELGFGPITMGTGIVTLKITDADVTNKRAKPTGVAGAEVYSFVAASDTTPVSPGGPLVGVLGRGWKESRRPAPEKRSGADRRASWRAVHANSPAAEC